MRGLGIRLRRAHRSVAIRDKFESHTASAPCGNNRQESERRCNQLGPGKRQVAGRADRWPPRGRRLSHESSDSRHKLCNRNGSGEKRIWKGRRRAKRVNRLCRTNSEPQKPTMTGTHPVQAYGHNAQVVQESENGYCAGQNPGVRSTWFFGDCHQIDQVSGSRCGVASTTTQDAQSEHFDRKSWPL